MAKPKVDTEVATQSADIIVSDQVPDYIKDGQRGSESVKTEDLVIPRLEIIQALSPAVKEGDPGYIASARPGMLMNSVTKQLYGKEVMVIPIMFTKQYLVWKKRKGMDAKGKEIQLEGGFFGAFNTMDEALARREEEGGEDNFIEVLDTPQHFCLLLNPGNGKLEEVMISMPRTKAKISRQWNSMVRLAGGDRFSRAYRVTSALEKKTQGDYYNFAIAPAGFPSINLYKQAESCYNQLMDGRAIKMDTSDLAGAETETESEM